MLLILIFQLSTFTDCTSANYYQNNQRQYPPEQPLLRRRPHPLPSPQIYNEQEEDGSQDNRIDVLIELMKKQLDHINHQMLNLTELVQSCSCCSSPTSTTTTPGYQTPPTTTRTYPTTPPSNTRTYPTTPPSNTRTYPTHPTTTRTYPTSPTTTRTYPYYPTPPTTTRTYPTPPTTTRTYPIPPPVLDVEDEGEGNYQTVPRRNYPTLPLSIYPVPPPVPFEQDYGQGDYETRPHRNYPTVPSTTNPTVTPCPTCTLPYFSNQARPSYSKYPPEASLPYEDDQDLEESARVLDVAYYPTQSPPTTTTTFQTPPPPIVTTTRLPSYYIRGRNTYLPGY